MHLRTIIFVLGIALGIIAGLSSPFGSELAVAALVLGAMQMTIYIAGRKRPEDTRWTLSLFTAIFAFAFFIGAVRAQFMEERVPYACASPCAFEGRVVTSPERKDAYQTFAIRPTDAEPNAYDVGLRVPLYPEYGIGEKIRVSGKLKEPSVIYPHGEKKAFDYSSYLHTRNIGSEMLFPKVESLGAGDESAVATLGRWKEDLVSKIDTYVSSPANTLSSGMLFGDSSMTKELSDTFRTAGLSHIVVLSGFNIAIVIAFILFVFAFFPLVVRVSLAVLAVILFVIMVGGEASVIRATLMSFVGLLATLLGREYVARQALLLSLLAIIMYDPASLFYSVSLHLSFLATAGIVYGSEAIKNITTPFLSNRFFVELVTTTLAAYIATLPYIMHTFGTVSAYALLANIIVLPIVPLVMLFSFLVVVASYLSHAAALVFGFANSFLADSIIGVARFVETFPGSSFVLSVSFGTMLVAYVAIVTLLFYLSLRKKDETPATYEQGKLTDIIRY